MNRDSPNRPRPVSCMPCLAGSNRVEVGLFMDEEMLPLTIVSASRYGEKDFFERSALGRSLSQAYSGFPVKSKIYFNNTKPMPTCYNDAISNTANAEEIFVFVHDDVYIVDWFWIDIISSGFKKFDILGIAGNKRRLPMQTSWAFTDESWTWDHPSNLSGIVGHGRQFPCELSIFGPPDQECKLLDGVFLATKKATLEKSNMKFDETFDFHFYDLDFCRQAEERKLRMGTIPLSIIHESGGTFGSPEWRVNRDKYINKWKE